MVYKNAPIREAIFDIKIDENEKVSLDVLENIHKEIKNEYPEKRQNFRLTQQINFKQEHSNIENNSSKEFYGLIFFNKKNTRVQAKIDGFTFNMIKPYSNWSSFIEEAFRIWEIYKRHVKPESIVRISLRYINKIEIPVPFKNFQEYVTNMPPIPNCLPQSFSNFFMQIQVPFVDDKLDVLLTQTIEHKLDNILPFILDIDVIKTKDLSTDSEWLRLQFEKFREIKNSTFENCITDNSRNLFN